MFAVILIFSALVINLAPILVEAGLTRTGAAGIAGLAGLASIAGKLSAGTLFDRLPPVAMTSGAMAAMGLACLLRSPSMEHRAAVARLHLHRPGIGSNRHDHGC